MILIDPGGHTFRSSHCSWTGFFLLGLLPASRDHLFSSLPIGKRPSARARVVPAKDAIKIIIGAALGGIITLVIIPAAILGEFSPAIEAGDWRLASGAFFVTRFVTANIAGRPCRFVLLHRTREPFAMVLETDRLAASECGTFMALTKIEGHRDSVLRVDLQQINTSSCIKKYVEPEFTKPIWKQQRSAYDIREAWCAQIQPDHGKRRAEPRKVDGFFCTDEALVVYVPPSRAVLTTAHTQKHVSNLPN